MFMLSVCYFTENVCREFLEDMKMAREEQDRVKSAKMLNRSVYRRWDGILRGEEKMNR